MWTCLQSHWHFTLSAAAPSLFAASSTDTTSTQQHDNHSSSSSSDQQQQQCPFLAGLTPPKGSTPWFKRPWQLLQPRQWQKEELEQHAVVVTPAAVCY
jgi:hypothetical protein